MTASHSNPFTATPTTAKINQTVSKTITKVAMRRAYARASMNGMAWAPGANQDDWAAGFRTVAH